MSSPADSYIPSSSGRFGYPVRVPKSRGSGPWAIASFIAIPLWFCALMTATLALEKPHVYQWQGCKGICTTWHDPTSQNEAAIWLWSLVPPLILIVVGWLCTRVRFGWYIACSSAIALAIFVVHDLNKWTLHHIARFPWGVDLIPSTNAASNQYDPGEWEKLARETALSFHWWTIGLSIVCMVTMGLVELRRHMIARRPSMILPEPDAEIGIHAPDSTGASVPVE